MRSRVQARSQPSAKLSARPPAPTRSVRVCFGHGGGPPPKGYLGDLRRAAIQLHSKEQLGNKKKEKQSSNGSSASNGSPENSASNGASGNGASNGTAKQDKQEKQQQQQQQQQFEPKVLGYLRFLQESKQVFDCIEGIVAESQDPSLTPFKSTGLERGDALAKDIEWLCNEKGIEPLAHGENKPGTQYVQQLKKLAAEDVPAFMCHYYNISFAHMAGGRMIGKAVSDRILDGAELAFYKYEGDSKEMGDNVKENIEAVAQTWSKEDQKRSVQQTADAFSYSGALLKCITQSCDCDCPRREIGTESPQQELAAA